MPTARTKTISAALALALVAGTPGAEANGRFPRAQRLIESYENADVMALYGTYGLLVTTDGGRSWRHVCEAAMGLYTGEDPLLEILPGERLLARTETNLVASGNSWCNWQSVLAEGHGFIQDITRDPTAPNTVLALTGTFSATVGYSALLIESENGGMTWSSPIALSPAMASRGLTLDVAPSRRNRLYVTGIDNAAAGKLLVSDDRGEVWQDYTIAGTEASAAPYLAAVSRTDPDRLYVRTDAYVELDGIDTAYDTLLLSTNGGQSFVPLINREAKLFGFALSPDEETLVVGYGDPVFAATYVEPEHLGIYRAQVAALLADPTNASDKFEKIYEGSVTCLRWSARGLFACTSQGEKGFEVGRADTASFSLSEPAPFEPMLRLNEIAPLSCGPGTDAFACYTDPVDGFPAVCRVLEAPCDVEPPTVVPDAGSPKPPDLPDASVGGPGVGDATPPRPEGADVDGSAANDSSSSSSPSSCGCRVLAGSPDRTLPWTALGLAAALASWCRRRARSADA